MLINLQFLQPGQYWPPKCERERLLRYETNKQLFERKHAEVYEEQLKRIERVIGNFDEVINYQVIINYQKLLSLKIADLLLGEEPKIKAGTSGSNESETAEKIIKDSDLINNLYKVALDISRYGEGLLYIYQEDGVGRIGFTQPTLWFPVVDKVTNRIINHVIAFIDEDSKTLTCQIHYKGYYELNEYSLDVGVETVIQSLKSSQIVYTNLTDFAIIHIPNVQTTSSIYGMDDYFDLDSIISEIIVRLSQISRVLDKHSSPSVQGPMGALEQDPRTGEWRLRMGNYFPRDSRDDVEVSYLTWDGQLQAAFTMVEKLTNVLYSVSEMGPTLLGDLQNAGGQATSGTAFKLRMISPLAKARRVAMRFAPGIEKAIRLCSELGGTGIINLKDAEVSVSFRDGLPNDDLEQANIMNTRTGGKATISQQRAIEFLNDMEESQAEEELQRILDEEASLNPLTPPPLSGENMPTNDEDDPDEVID